MSVKLRKLIIGARKKTKLHVFCCSRKGEHKETVLILTCIQESKPKTTETFRIHPLL